MVHFLKPCLTVVIFKISLLFIIYFSSHLAAADNSALIIMDMQPLFATRDGSESEGDNPAKLQKAMDRQIQLIEMAKREQAWILVVEFQDHGKTYPAIIRAIDDYDRVDFFIKDSDSIFSDYGAIANVMQDYLNDKDITDLVIAGANGGGCVKCSITDALNNGYRVWTNPYAIIDLNLKGFAFPYTFTEGSLRLKNLELEQNLIQSESTSEIVQLMSRNNKPGAKPARAKKASAAPLSCVDIFSKARLPLLQRFFYKLKLAQ